jgi:hypothetical protein
MARLYSKLEEQSKAALSTATRHALSLCDHEVGLQNFSQYIAAFGAGAVIESILSDKEKVREFDTPIVLISHEDGGNNKFYCFFRVPAKYDKNLSAGEPASAVLREGCATTTNWDYTTGDAIDDLGDMPED